MTIHDPAGLLADFLGLCLMITILVLFGTSAAKATTTLDRLIGFMPVLVALLGTIYVAFWQLPSTQTKAAKNLATYGKVHAPEWHYTGTLERRRLRANGSAEIETCNHFIGDRPINCPQWQPMTTARELFGSP